jgi:Mrp family chromosome partitioning ATPase
MRSIARQDQSAPESSSKKDVLARRLLAEGVAAALRAGTSRHILIVSARNGDGKSRLFYTLAVALGAAEPGAWRFLDTETIQAIEPGDVQPTTRVIIDGAALLDGDGGIRLSPEWLSAIDGALIVLLAGRTTESEVAQLRARLDVLGIPPLGVVWNDRDDRGLPSLLAALRRRAASVRQMFPGRGPARAAREHDRAGLLSRAGEGSAA